jgi:hypothetical protein
MVRPRPIRNLNVKRIAAAFQRVNRNIFSLATHGKPAFARLFANKPGEPRQINFCAGGCSCQKMPIGGVKTIPTA